MQWMRGCLKDPYTGVKILEYIDLEDRLASGRRCLLRALVPEEFPLLAPQTTAVVQAPHSGPPCKRPPIRRWRWRRDGIYTSSLYSGCATWAPPETFWRYGRGLPLLKKKKREWTSRSPTSIRRGICATSVKNISHHGQAPAKTVFIHIRSRRGWRYSQHISVPWTIPVGNIQSHTGG